MAEVSHCVPYQFVHPSVHGQPGLLAALGIINKVAVNTPGQVFLGTYVPVSLGTGPKSAVAACQAFAQRGAIGPGHRAVPELGHSAACVALSAVSLCDVSHSGECGVYLIRVLTCNSRGPPSLCTEPFAVCVCVLQGDCSCLAALEVLYLAPRSDFWLASQGDRRCGFDRLLEAPGSAGLELASPVCAGSMCLSAGGGGAARAPEPGFIHVGLALLWTLVPKTVSAAEPVASASWWAAVPPRGSPPPRVC